MKYPKCKKNTILVVIYVLFLITFIFTAYYFSPKYAKPIHESLNTIETSYQREGADVRWDRGIGGSGWHRGSGSGKGQSGNSLNIQCGTRLTADHPNHGSSNYCTKVIKQPEMTLGRGGSFKNGLSLTDGGDGGTGNDPGGISGPRVGQNHCYPKDSNGDPILDKEGNMVLGTVNVKGVCVPNRIDPYNYCPQVQKLMHDSWKLKVWYPYYEEDSGLHSDVIKYWDVYDYVADFIRLNHKYGIECPVSYIP